MVASVARYTLSADGVWRCFAHPDYGTSVGAVFRWTTMVGRAVWSSGTTGSPGGWNYGPLFSYQPTGPSGVAGDPLQDGVGGWVVPDGTGVWSGGRYTTTSGVPNGTVLTELGVTGGNLNIDQAWLNANNGGSNLIQNLHIRCTVTVLVNLIFQSCYFHYANGGTSGTTGPAGMLVCADPTLTNVITNDCTFVPDVPAVRGNGIFGHHWVANRCYGLKILDMFDSNNVNSGQASNTHVIMRGNCVEGFCYFWQDPQQAGKTGVDHGSHNDCWQSSGGTGDICEGNSFYAFILPGIGDYSLYLANQTGIPLNQGKAPWGSCALMSPILADCVGWRAVGNWFDGGSASFKVQRNTRGSVNGGLLYKNNFGNRQWLSSGSGHYCVIQPATGTAGTDPTVQPPIFQAPGTTVLNSDGTVTYDATGGYTATPRFNYWLPGVNGSTSASPVELVWGRNLGIEAVAA